MWNRRFKNPNKWSCEWQSARWKESFDSALESSFQCTCGQRKKVQGWRLPRVTCDFSFLIYWYIYWLLWVFVCGLSLVEMSRGCSVWTSHCSGLLLQSTGSGSGGLSDCGTWAALRHMRSSWTRDRTGVPCIVRQSPNHWTTREVPLCYV